MSTQQGEIVSFDAHKGYGWIATDDGPDVFVHVNDLDSDRDEVRTGARVSFVAEDGPKGVRAVRVRVLGGAGQATERTPARIPDIPDARPRADDDLEVDVLSTAELRAEVTERLLAIDPPLLATQVIAIRGAMDAMARRYGWVAD